MARIVRRGLLILVTGVLLGMLAFLILQRAQSRSEAPPPLPIPSAAAQPSAPVEIPGVAAPSPLPDPAAGAEEIFTRFLGEYPDGWELCYMALPEGELLLRGGEGPVVSASLVKLAVMGAVYEQRLAGKLTAEETDDRLRAMITWSDNEAANALILLLGEGSAETGMAAVNEWCLRQGLTETRLNRLMLRDNGLQNYTSAADCGRLLGAIYRGECVSPEASEAMLTLLLDQRVDDRFPRGLPEGTPIAHKTGDLVGLCWADAAIVFSPGGDYVLCAICDGTLDETSAKTAMAELSRQIYEKMTQSR